MELYQFSVVENMAKAFILRNGTFITDAEIWHTSLHLYEYLTMDRPDSQLVQISIAPQASMEIYVNTS